MLGLSFAGGRFRCVPGSGDNSTVRPVVREFLKVNRRTCPSSPVAEGSDAFSDALNSSDDSNESTTLG